MRRSQVNGACLLIVSALSLSPRLQSQIIDTARTVVVNGVAEPVYSNPEGIIPTRQIFAPEPEYSKEARRKHIEGVVVVSLVVTSEGKPADIRVTSARGYGLDQKAVDAIRQWKFQPATKDGRPVSSEVDVEISFRLYQRH